MVATQSDDFAQKLRLFRSHGIIKDPALFDRPYAGGWDTDMVELGYNYRLTDIASALGSSQMKRLDGFIARRKEIAALYEKLLEGVVGVTLPPDHPGTRTICFAFAWMQRFAAMFSTS
jgi:Predicted pyridoxal phosphate-dependent enzyme apparently involved in regulation of cell wall biogenesis